MEMNDFKEKWKKELDSNFQFSQEEKSQILKNVMTGQKQNNKIHNRNWAYPFVLGGFAIIGAFLLLVTIYNHRSYSDMTTVADSVQLTNVAFSPTLFWFLIIYGLTGFAITALIFTILNTTRWRNLKKYAQIKFLPWFIFTYILISVPTYLIVDILQILFLKLWVVLIITALNCIYLLWCIRHRKQAACPHCGNRFTSKKIFSMSWNSYRTKCEYCNERIYHSTAAKKSNSAMITVPLLTFFTLSFFQIPFPFIMLSFLVISFLFNLYITKFTISYSKEDEPLW
ncbi:CXXC-20-CXXC protein [Ureibacillus xyleni]|uniref:CXXC-20-CXXC protein n=1 Tax=Ureibacillus xyleni TaxID=614648 RepID=A0A285TKY7_9BACL|nr:hypothetical protein [Ureibacillus xyleni]SOC21141.1 CXXC-20-CXXC protein [Ureibacillus xyleni]